MSGAREQRQGRLGGGMESLMAVCGTGLPQVRKAKSVQ